MRITPSHVCLGGLACLGLKSLVVTYALPETSVALPAVAGTGALVLMSVAFLSCFRPITAVAGALLIDLLGTVLLNGDLIHARFLHDPLPAAKLRDVQLLAVFPGTITNGFARLDAVLYLDLVLLAVVALFSTPREQPPAMWPLRRRVGVATVAVLCATPAVAEVVNDTQNLFSWAYCRAEAAGRIGLLPFHLYEGVNILFDRIDADAVSEVDLRGAEGLVLERRVTRAGDTQAVPSARPNLIVIQAEALHAFAVAASVEGRLIAPHLHAFSRESLRFTRFFDQTWDGATSDAVFLAMQSLHPLPPGRGAISTKFQSNTYLGLPAILAHHGYRTFAAVGAPPQHWALGTFFTRLGFERRFFDADYAGAMRWGEGVADHEILSRTVTEHLRDVDSPFFLFVVTSSSHHPYELPEQFRQPPLTTAVPDQELARYLESIRYLDSAFGGLMRALEHRQLLERTIVVIYGDHQAWLGDSPALAQLSGVAHGDAAGMWRLRKHLPLLVRLPGGAPAEDVATPGGHIDIAPTLLGLLGLPSDDAVMLGSDLLRPKSSAVVFRDGSFAADNGYYIHGSPARCFDVRTHAAKECAELAREQAAARTELAASDAIIRDDAIPRLSHDRRTRHLR